MSPRASRTRIGNSASKYQDPRAFPVTRTGLVMSAPRGGDSTKTGLDCAACGSESGAGAVAAVVSVRGTGVAVRFSLRWHAVAARVHPIRSANQDNRAERFQ